MAKVFGRLVASKRTGPDSTTERESDSFVESTLTSDFHTITVFARADGRATVEVKTRDGRIVQSLNITADGTLLAIGGNIIDGKGVA